MANRDTRTEEGRRFWRRVDELGQQSWTLDADKLKYLSTLSNEKLLRDLLAVIHRDGGHHAAKVGNSQGVADAMIVVYGLRSQVEEMRAKLEQIVCPHEHVGGGNDYLRCDDCGLTWDYRGAARPSSKEIARKALDAFKDSV